MSNSEQQVQQEIILTTEANLAPEISLTAFQQKLAVYINELINHDFEKLVNILYRLDVSEKKLKTTLASCSASDAGLLIAAMIIERQMQKNKNVATI